MICFRRSRRFPGKELRSQRYASGIHMGKYSDFRQYPQFQATFADNAETIDQQLKKH